MNELPELLVVHIVRAQGVAMEQQRGLSGDLKNRLIWQKGAADIAGELLPQHEVAVTAREEDLGA